MLRALTRAGTPVVRGCRAAASAAPRRMASATARRATLSRLGHPQDVVQIEDTEIRQPGANEVVVEMKAAAVSAYDLAQIKGFGSANAGEMRCGNEGVGQVIETGDGVSNFSKGDYVVAAAPGIGTWATHVTSSADNFVLGATQKEVAAAKPEDRLVEKLAVSVGAPALAQSLLQFAELEEGDVVAISAAETAVGQCLNQLCASIGVITVNIADTRPDWDRRAALLQDLNHASVNIPDTMAHSFEFSKVTADLPPAKLALDGAGGASALAIARLLGPGCTLVSYANQHKKPVVLPSDLLLERGIVARGFNLAAYLSMCSAEDRAAVASTAVERTLAGSLRQQIAWEPFEDLGVAIERASRPWERAMVVKFGVDKDTLP